MKAPLLLRIASVITLLYFIGHTAGIPWTPAVGPAEAPVLEAMKARSFDAEGFERTYWNFYFGFGVIISVFLLVQSVALWQIGSLARADARRVRPIVASFLVAFIINAILAWKYFFALPAVMAASISLCLAIALVTAGKAKSPPSIAPGDAS